METAAVLDSLIAEYMTTDRIILLIGLYNAFVQALPDPKDTDGRGYVFLYKLAHGLAFNFNVVRKRVDSKPRFN